MHIQASGQHNDNGESLQCAAVSQLAAMAAGRRRVAGLLARCDRDLPLADGARKRLGRYERYSMRRGRLAGSASRNDGARAALISRKAMHGGFHLVYRRPSGDIDRIGTGAGPERFARG